MVDVSGLFPIFYNLLGKGEKTMMKLLKLKKNHVFKGDKEYTLVKGDYVPEVSRTASNVTVFINGLHFTEKNALFEAAGDIPQFTDRFCHTKIQKFVEIVDYAKDKGFIIDDNRLGTFPGPGEKNVNKEPLSQQTKQALVDNTKKVLYWMSRMNFEDVEANKTYGDLAVMNHLNQGIYIDFTSMIDDRFVIAVKNAMDDFRPLEKSELRKKEHKKIVLAWTKDLQSRETELASEAKKFSTQLEKYQTDMTQAYANIRRNLAEQRAVHAVMHEDVEDMMERLKEVEDLPFVKSTDYDGPTLIVKFNDFDQIYTVRKQKYKVHYKGMQVKLNPTTVEITHNNPFSRDGSKYHHMHIQGPDETKPVQFACFGDHGTRVTRALAMRRFKEVIFLARNLIGSHNPGDTLCPIEPFLVHMKAAKWTDGRDRDDDDDYDDDSEDYDGDDQIIPTGDSLKIKEDKL